MNELEPMTARHTNSPTIRFRLMSTDIPEEVLPQGEDVATISLPAPAELMLRDENLHIEIEVRTWTDDGYGDQTESKISQITMNLGKQDILGSQLSAAGWLSRVLPHSCCYCSGFNGCSRSTTLNFCVY